MQVKDFTAREVEEMVLKHYEDNLTKKHPNAVDEMYNFLIREGREVPKEDILKIMGRGYCIGMNEYPHCCTEE